jgi:hypothetical protein
MHTPMYPRIKLKSTPLINSSPHMLSLPLDVIHYELFPLLDYSSRIAVNRILPSQERKGTPLKEGSVDEFKILFAQCMLRRFISIGKSKTGTPAEVCQACDEFIVGNCIGLRYSKGLGIMFIGTLTFISNRIYGRIPWPELTVKIKERIEHFFLRTAEFCLGKGRSFPFQAKYTAVNNAHVQIPWKPVEDYEDIYG